MSVIEENDNVIQSKHQELCFNLNMDVQSAEKSWEAYKEIKNNYTLYGDQTHWLCCALYVACRKSVIPTVGSSRSIVEGNCVSLTRLLRICNISLNEFFKKMKKWCEMASVPPDFRQRIDHLERSFAVSTLLYQKFTPIFQDLFICPPSEELRVGKGKKVKSTPCTANKVFELCWCLFICAKGNCPQQDVDLVTSFDMLLCCADLIFSNAIVDNRRDLINPNYPGIPEEWKRGEKIDYPVCIMDQLCERHEGTKVDAIETKQYTWKGLIKSFFDKNIIRGDSQNFLNILSVGNFESNLKSLNNLYDTYTLSCGEFDERIFLNHQEIGSSRLGGSVIKSESKLGYNMDETIKRLVKETPVTRRECLPNKHFLTPVATATQSVNKLRLTLNDYNGSPPQSLQDFFATCEIDPTQKIQQILQKMSTKFCDKFKPNGPERFRLAEALYYRLLDNIVRLELKRKPFDLNHEIIHSTLVACSVEIVLTAYNSQTKFPWILETLEMDAYNFYKIIEIVVLCHQDLLTRDIIKHLNSIEEQCLESYIWVSKSPIWEQIKQLTIPIPSCQDVARKNDADLSGIVPHNPEYKKDELEESSNSFISSMYQPKFASFQSPSKAMAKMQLFKTGNPKDEPPSINDLTNRQNSNNESRSQNPPNKMNGLGLFFRKFYELAYPRLKNLCTELRLNNDDVLIKIWTIFQHSIIEKTELMKDRHLDQILMCAIYVFNRVTKLNRTFTDIMKFYRFQPQSESHVYRSVLISYRNDKENRSEKKSETSAPVPLGPAKPGDLAGISTSHENEERGDIIKFYNTVYVQQMQQFAMKFANEAFIDQIPLSPLPPPRLTLQSPIKLSSNYPLYIQQLERKDNPQETIDSIVYTFNRSPAKDFVKINNIVANGVVIPVGRRILTNEVVKRNLASFDDASPFVPNKIIKIENDDKTSNKTYSTMNRKINTIINDRQDEIK